MKKLLATLLAFGLLAGTAWAANFSDDFPGAALDVKWTAAFLQGASGSNTVSGGNLNLTVTGDGGTGAYWVTMGSIALPGDFYIKFTESGTPNMLNQTSLIIYKTGPTADSMGIISSNNNILATSIKNLQISGGSKTMGASPFYFHINVDGAGVVTVETKNAAGAWVEFSPPISPIAFGEALCKIAMLCIAGPGLTWNSHIEWIDDYDHDAPTPTPTVTTNPWEGFHSWQNEGFSTW